MSYYVHGTDYKRYLQDKNFYDALRLEVSQVGLNMIATKEELARQGLNVQGAIERAAGGTAQALETGFGNVGRELRGVSDRVDRMHETLAGGFVVLHRNLASIEASIHDLGAKFHWGIGKLEEAIGGLGDFLEKLVQIARTPEQTWAYEQFALAREATERGLYPEALEYLERAINGNASHTGYKIEHRFYHFLGRILRGDFENKAFIDLQMSEDAYLTAHRYASRTNPEDAGRALTGAAYAAYCQQDERKVEDADRHLVQAIRLCPGWGEAHFLRGKIRMHKGLVADGLNALETAAHSDPLFLAKALADGDYRKYEAQVVSRIEAMRDRAAGEAQRIAFAIGSVVTGCHGIALEVDRLVEPFKTMTHGILQTAASDTTSLLKNTPLAFKNAVDGANYGSYLGAREALAKLTSLSEVVRYIPGGLNRRIEIHVQPDIKGASAFIDRKKRNEVKTGISAVSVGLAMQAVIALAFGWFAGNVLQSTPLVLGVVAYLIGLFVFGLVRDRSADVDQALERDLAQRRESVDEMAKQALARLNEMRSELSGLETRLR